MSPAQPAPITPALGASLLPTLEKRQNLGCHVEFGRAARLLRLSRAREYGQSRLRLTFRTDDETGSCQALFPLATLLDKHLPRTSPALRPGARIFILNHAERPTDHVFFVEDPQEIVNFLRRNVDFLRQRNDKRSWDIFLHLTGLTVEDAQVDDRVCAELRSLRRDSPSHLRGLINRCQNAALGKSLFAAIEKGEIMDLTAGFASMLDLVTSLTDRDVNFIVNVIRARYMHVLSRQQGEGGAAELTPLGRKVFGFEGRNPSFSRAEKEMLLSLALRADNASQRFASGSLTQQGAVETG